MKSIKIQGIKNTSKFEDYVASSLVDIAYFDGAINDTVILSVEDDINLDNAEDKKWITELLNQGLLECQEVSAKIVFE